MKNWKSREEPSHSDSYSLCDDVSWLQIESPMPWLQFYNYLSLVIQVVVVMDRDRGASIYLSKTQHRNPALLRYFKKWFKIKVFVFENETGHSRCTQSFHSFFLSFFVKIKSLMRLQWWNQLVRVYDFSMIIPTNTDTF